MKPAAREAARHESAADLLGPQWWAAVEAEAAVRATACSSGRSVDVDAELWADWPEWVAIVPDVSPNTTLPDAALRDAGLSEAGTSNGMRPGARDADMGADMGADVSGSVAAGAS
ncbi:hypothetical protein, partial [Sphaerimonospora thailandensis]|uniref:hypothetical protein n=1 Tax=Sphaerimonospora thailandensis TaxID=795644 RepID=UPI00194DF2D0